MVLQVEVPRPMPLARHRRRRLLRDQPFRRLHDYSMNQQYFLDSDQAADQAQQTHQAKMVLALYRQRRLMRNIFNSIKLVKYSVI